MRLSQLVKERGIDPFQFEDFLFVGQKLSLDPTRLVLVGGQAIETWGHYYDAAPPSGDHAPLTEDTDFYGSHKDAKWLCSLLGKQSTEVIINSNFDPSPNTAVAFIQRPDGRVLLIDFLRAVVGLKHDEIVRLAVTVMVAGVRINVLHPLYCLESRLANLDKLPAKRNSNGVMQAKWAIDIAQAYLLNIPENPEHKGRDLIKACHLIAESAEFRSGPYCFHTFGIDALTAVTPAVLDRVGGRFVSEDWPRRVERIRAKRAKKLVSYRIDALPQPIGVANVKRESGIGLPEPVAPGNTQGVLPRSSS